MRTYTGSGLGPDFSISYCGICRFRVRRNVPRGKFRSWITSGSFLFLFLFLFLLRFPFLRRRCRLCRRFCRLLFRFLRRTLRLFRCHRDALQRLKQPQGVPLRRPRSKRQHHVPLIAHFRHAALRLKPLLQLVAAPPVCCVVYYKLKRVLNSICSGPAARARRLDEAEARQFIEAAARRGGRGQPACEQGGPLGRQQASAHVERSHDGIGRAGALQHRQPLAQQRAVDQPALHMQHRAHRERGEHLVRRLHDAIGALGQRALRQRRMLAEVGAVRLVDEQRHAVRTAELGQRPQRCAHPVVARVRDEQPFSAGVPAQGFTHRLRRRDGRQAARRIEPRRQKHRVRARQHQSVDDGFMHVPLHEQHIARSGAHAQDQRQIAGCAAADKKKRLLRPKLGGGQLLRLTDRSLRMMQIIRAGNFRGVDFHHPGQHILLRGHFAAQGLSVFMSRHMKGNIVFFHILHQSFI